MQTTSTIDQIFDAISLVQSQKSPATLQLFSQVHSQYLALLRAIELATDYHPGPKETRSSIKALKELQDGMGELLVRCETHVRYSDLEFRIAISGPLHTALKSLNVCNSRRVESIRDNFIQARDKQRLAENRLQGLVDAIQQQWRKCPCGRHTYRARLDSEPAIVSVLTQDQGPCANVTRAANVRRTVSDGRTQPFDSTPTFRPTSMASAVCAAHAADLNNSHPPAPPPMRQRIYITDYFAKKSR